MSAASRLLAAYCTASDRLADFFILCLNFLHFFNLILFLSFIFAGLGNAESLLGYRWARELGRLLEEHDDVAEEVLG